MKNALWASVATLLASSLVHAAEPSSSLEARRYRSADGVEMLTDRARPALPVTATPTTPSSFVATASGVSLIASAAPSRAAHSAAASEPVVSTGLQKQRDEVRAEILWQELNQATRSWQAAQKALTAPRARLDLSSAELAALSDSAARHAQDIKAIHAELKRLRPEIDMAAPLRRVASAR